MDGTSSCRNTNLTRAWWAESLLGSLPSCMIFWKIFTSLCSIILQSFIWLLHMAQLASLLSVMAAKDDLGGFNRRLRPPGEYQVKARMWRHHLTRSEFTDSRRVLFLSEQERELSPQHSMQVETCGLSCVQRLGPFDWVGFILKC